MPIYCCVPFCKSDSKKINVSFHEFPVDVNLKNAWLRAIARKDFQPNDKSCSSKVCGFHFKASDFIPNRKRRCLKQDSVPSIFPCYPAYLTSRKIDKRVLKRKLENSDYVPKRVFKNKQENSYYLSNESVKVAYNDQTETSNLLMLADSCCNETNQLDRNTEKSKSSDMVNSKVPIAVNSQTKETQTTIDSSIVSKSLDSENYKVPNAVISKTKETQTRIDRSILSSNLAELRRLRRLLVRRDKKIESLQKDLEENAKIAEYFKRNTIAQNVEKMVALCNGGYANNQVEFTLTQISNFNKKNPRWPDTFMRECVLLHASSPEAYETLQNRQLFLLPSTRTLARFLDTPLPGQSLVEESTFQAVESSVEHVSRVVQISSLEHLSNVGHLSGEEQASTVEHLSSEEHQASSVEHLAGEEHQASSVEHLAGEEQASSLEYLSSAEQALNVEYWTGSG